MGGTAFRMVGSNSPTYARLWSSRFFRDLPAIAYLRLKINDNSSTQAMLHVVVNDGTADMTSLTLHGNDFAAPNQYQEFALPFTLPAAGGGLLTFQIQRSGSADVYWDAASLYTAPLPAESPLMFHAPGNYYRSSGAQARLISPTGEVSAPIELYPHLSRMEGLPAPNALTLTASPAALAFSVPGSGAVPVTAHGESRLPALRHPNLAGDYRRAMVDGQRRWGQPDGTRGPHESGSRHLSRSRPRYRGRRI